MKQEYTAYVAAISSSGRDGDDEGLFNKPEFFEEMHELERDKARHAPPAVLSTENGSTVSDAPLSSSRKRFKLSHRDFLSEYIEKQEERHADILSEIRKGNEEKSKMRSAIEALVAKF